MKVDILLGLQWGDEGKGKVVDLLAPDYHVVARFQGGPNAGHTLEFGDTKHVLHQIPSGIFREGVKNVIGNGVVLDPVVFRKEIEDLEKLGVDCQLNLYLSDKASLIMPSHRLLDAAFEKKKGDSKIGSTLRGIGPAYQDKYGRNGLRVGDVLRSDFISRYEEILDGHKWMLDNLKYGADNIEELSRAFFDACEYLKRFKIEQTEYLINEELKDGRSVLAEGAQGSLLDIDFGSYPFVTSSNTISSGVCSGLGVSPRHIGRVIGVFKAYCTRVGSGPFPSELFDEIGKELASKGHEFGATTGRPRRVGWLDMPALIYSCMLNGVTDLYIMKADVMDGFDEVSVVESYRMPDGQLTERYPGNLEGVGLGGLKSFPGWGSSLDGEQKVSAGLHSYLNYITGKTQVPIRLVSVGPKRKQSVWLKD